MRLAINPGTRPQFSQRRRLRAAKGKCWSVSGRCRSAEVGAAFKPPCRAAAGSVASKAYLACQPP